VFAKINSLGFIETPYREVKNGAVDFNQPPVYLTAEEEENKIIAQAITPMDDNGHFTEEAIKARYVADYPIVSPEEIQLIDVGPNQIASIAASLIPFLEHDDANRALMGSNMMRQAVPLMNPEAPIVGTGIERYVAKDSRVLITAEGEGEVVFVDSTKITIKYERTDEERLVSMDDDYKTYYLTKYARTNQNTSINIKPTVRRGQKVHKGDVITQGYGTQNGDLALGRNLKVAFMPWKGYNYEDAIVISERIVKEDLFTSIHVEEFTLEVRDTKRGLEELTNDIPNVSAEATKDLDDHGLIRVG
jgi:DNA-directed RNA polymerase subunit beta